MHEEGGALMLSYLLVQATRVYVLLTLVLVRATSFLVPASHPARACWLVGEHRGHPQRDNGYCFFRYCQQHGLKHVYFVAHASAIAADDFLRQSSQVVRYGSPRHLWLFAHAAVLMYTHTYRDLLYPRFFRLAAPGRKLVFLQHGVTAFKRFHPLYQQTCNDMDIVLAVSDVERDILTRQVGTEPSRVRVTGFPRFDYLEDRSSGAKPVKVLYFPTWRDWITASNVEDSEFLRRVRSLLASRRLEEILVRHDAELTVCLHARMREHPGRIPAS